MASSAFGLGRKTPTDWEHVDKYSLECKPEAALVVVNKRLTLPWWYYKGQHQQWNHGACVGFGTSLMKAIVDIAQTGHTVRYDPWWLWDWAKERDDWADTNPGDDEGTSVRAACDVLRQYGHVKDKKWVRDYPGVGTTLSGEMTPDPANGIKENRWATTLDDIRACINLGVPVSFGINWYSNFDAPVQRGRHWWIDGPMTDIRGGHDICIIGAFDRLEALELGNSWGRSYPLRVLLPYGHAERVLSEDGEACIITDL